MSVHNEILSDVHGKRENGFSTPGGESSTREVFGGTKELLLAIRSSFRDVLIGNEEMILQVGLFVC